MAWIPYQAARTPHKEQPRSPTFQNISSSSPPKYRNKHFLEPEKESKRFSALQPSPAGQYNQHPVELPKEQPFFDLLLGEQVREVQEVHLNSAYTLRPDCPAVRIEASDSAFAWFPFIL